MGRYAGWIALYSGLSGSADVILLPEIPFDIEKVCEKIRQREAAGRHFSIVVVAEGARPKDGADRAGRAARRRHRGPAGRDREQGGAVHRAPHRQGDPHAGARPPAARRLADHVRPAARAPVRRGGGPRDRRRRFGTMVGLNGPDITRVPLDEVVGQREERPAGQRYHLHRAGARHQSRRLTRSDRNVREGPLPPLGMPDAQTRYPPTPASDATDVLHGEPIADPYRWLEDGDSAETRAWTERQNALTEAYLAAVPGRERSGAGWTSCSRSARSACPTPVERPLLLPAARRPPEPAGALRARGRRGRRPRRARPERARRRRHDRARLVLPERRRTAARLRPLATDGSEQSVLHVLDVDTGALLPDRIPGTRAADLAWLPDGTRLLLHALPRRRGTCPRARSTTTARSTSTRSAPIRRRIRSSSSPSRRSTGPA